jgi:hypothetical protein
MRVAVTGAHGRLGRALIEALEQAPFTGTRGPIAWSRPELDLDTLTAQSAAALIDRDRPEVVIHAAAWTDVDGCARPGLRCAGTPSTGILAVGRPGVDSSSSRPTRCSTAAARTAPATRRGTRPTRSTRTGRASWPPRRWHAGRTRMVAEHPAWRSCAPAGSTDRPATTFRPGSRPRPCARLPPARRCGSSVTRSAVRRTRQTSPRRSSSCWGRTRWPSPGIAWRSTTWSTRAARRAPTGRARSRATGHRCRDCRGPGEHLAARLHAAAVGRACPDAAAVGRADARLARGVCRRGPGAAPVAPRRLTSIRRAGGPAPHAHHPRTTRDRTGPHPTPRLRIDPRPKGPPGS